MHPNTVLWIYIVLLVAGGLVGFLKAGSKMSLITSAAFAAGLILTLIPGLLGASLASGLANVLLAILLVFFAMRLAKSKKFMPSGLMVVVTLAALVLRNVRF